MFSAWPPDSVLPAPPVPEPAEGCEPENLFFRQDPPVAAGGRGLVAGGTRVRGGKQEVTSGVEPASQRQRG